MRVRIAMLVANPIAFDGRVCRHASTLARAGHEVRVFGVIGPNDRADAPRAASDAAPWQWERLDRRRHAVGPGLRWATSALQQRMAARLWPHAMEWLGPSPPRTALDVRELLGGMAVATSGPELAIRAACFRPEAIHANDLSTLPAGIWAGRLLNVPVVYDAHEVYVDEEPGLSPQVARLRAWIEGRLTQQVAAICTVNELLAQDLMKRYGVPRPVVVRNLPGELPFAVPSPAERPLGARGTLRVLYHGAHIGLSQHGVDDILRAMARLRDLPGVVLILRGGLLETERAALVARLEELQIGTQVQIEAPVPGAAALVESALHDRAEVGLAVHPGLCLSYLYTTSSKLYEYQIAGLAICASDVLGNRHTVTDGAGVFYPAGDDLALANCLRTMAVDRQQLREYQMAAYSYAQAELRWEREGSALTAIYSAMSRS